MISFGQIRGSSPKEGERWLHFSDIGFMKICKRTCEVNTVCEISSFILNVTSKLLRF